VVSPVGAAIGVPAQATACIRLTRRPSVGDDARVEWELDLDYRRWVRRFTDRPRAALRLVCFPHAGGSASYFRPLAQALAPDIGLAAIQYPGRQDRRHEKPAGSLAELADAVTAVLGTDPRHEPTVFFGHSMGATLAFEVIRRYARESGDAPLGLIASGRRAPSIPRDDTLHTRPDYVLLREMRNLNGTDADLLGDPEIREMILPVLRADYRVIETYRFDGGPPLSIPIHGYIGDADPRVTVDEVRAWEAHTAATFELRVFAGGHFYLGDMPAGRLAAEIEQSIQSFAAAAAVSHADR
jgi:pyochelin biosynthesis protein PchC